MCSKWNMIVEPANTLLSQDWFQNKTGHNYVNILSLFPPLCTYRPDGEFDSRWLFLSTRHSQLPHILTEPPVVLAGILSWNPLCYTPAPPSMISRIITDSLSYEFDFSSISNSCSVSPAPPLRGIPWLLSSETAQYTIHPFPRILMDSMHYVTELSPALHSIQSQFGKLPSLWALH